VSRELGRDHTPHALLDQSESIVSVGLVETKYSGFKLGKLYGRSKQIVFSLTAVSSPTTGLQEPSSPTPQQSRLRTPTD
jgi:hypothetical protein